MAEGNSQVEKRYCSLILIFALLTILTMATEMANVCAESDNYEFRDGFENGFSQWDGRVRGFPDDPVKPNPLGSTK